MVRHTWIFLVTLLACTAAFADPPQKPAWESDPHPTLVVPPLSALATSACDGKQPQIGVVRQDPTNLYYSARVYAAAVCGAAGTDRQLHEGCALVQWDPTGTSYTILQVIYQRQDSAQHPTGVHGPARCLTETLATG